MTAGAQREKTEARAFEAVDEQGAVKAAADELGIKAEKLEYEVVDPGSKGFLGMGGKPTRIVVTVSERSGEEEGSTVETKIREFQKEILSRMRMNLDLKVESSEEYIYLKMTGPDSDQVLQNRAELLEVFQYLLNRIFAKALLGRRILADCDGFRKKKEEELKQIAKRVSEHVKVTGVQQELDLMNPYERRVVHLAIADEEGVKSQSCGEGVKKRVNIIPA